jgi:hypothetical protein
VAESRLGRGFARDVEAILSVLAMQNQDGNVYLYPWEVRQNLRMAGMRLDKAIPEFSPVAYDWERHEPEFDPEPEFDNEEGDLIDEEDAE